MHFPRCVMIYGCVELAPNQPEREREREGRERERDSRQLNSLKCVPHVCCNMEKISALSPPLTITGLILTLQQPAHTLLKRIKAAYVVQPAGPVLTILSVPDS